MARRLLHIQHFPRVFGVQGSRVSGLGSRVSGLGFRVSSLKVVFSNRPAGNQTVAVAMMNDRHPGLLGNAHCQCMLISRAFPTLK